MGSMMNEPLRLGAVAGKTSAKEYLTQRRKGAKLGNTTKQLSLRA
jgi:hypothetical protein